MQKGKGKPAGLPAGYTDTSGGKDFPKPWTPEQGDSLEGTVVRKRQEDAQKLKRRKAKKGDKVYVVEVADKSGEIFSVFESKGIEDWCKQVAPGYRVFIRLDEVKKMPGGRRFKRFTSGFSKGRK